jgi:FkbM family methyltransferase
MKIFYGAGETFIDVTDICLLKLTRNNVITIPSGDHNRAKYFTDPLFGVLKRIIVQHNDSLTNYDHLTEIKINVIDNTVTSKNENDINDKIQIIHSRLKITHGTLDEELPEQKMVVRYLTGNEKVLEIGGNIGRNSLMISSILRDSANLVVLESDVNIAKQLQENRDLNHFKFHIESSALSKRTLIQKHWETIPSNILQDGYNWVNTITLDGLKEKYNIEFDTLVLDCEGAFYYILMDMPEILNNINLIIIENDYHNINHKKYVDSILIQNNFYVEYSENGCALAKQIFPQTFENFYEVWKKR